MKYLLSGQETDRIQFRNIEETDFDKWLTFFQDPTSHMHWGIKMGTPEQECQKWYALQKDRHSKNRGGMNALIEKSTGQFMGHCGLLVQEVDQIIELEVGYSLLGKFRGRGFATEAAIKCRDFAFHNNLTKSLISIISFPNIPSQKVAELNGMKIEKSTKFHGIDVYIYRITVNEWENLH